MVVPSGNGGTSYTHHATHKHAVLQAALASKNCDAVQLDSAKLMIVPVSWCRSLL